MLKQFVTTRTKTFQQLSAVIAVVIIAGIGTYLLTVSHATAPYASATVDGGTLAGAATRQTCSGASDNNNCVVFGGASSAPSVVIGANGAGADAEIAAKFSGAGIKWDRVEFMMPSTGATYQGPNTDAGYGLSVVAIINTNDGTPLSSIDPVAYANYGLALIKANPSVNLWEVGNEIYLKGGINNPVAYGKMYLDLYNAVKSSGITGKTLMFNMFGDYFNSTTGQWSQDYNGGGWLHDAVAGNPGLAAAIASEALSSHPYGGITDYGQDEKGPHALAGLNGDNPGSACPSGCSQEVLAQDYLGSIPPIYVTEFGFQVSEVGTASSPVSDAGLNTTCSTQQEGQAYLLTEAYNIFLADSHVKGIWWYSSHDDGTGHFGLLNLNSDFSLNSVRPSFNALTQELDLKQHTASCNS